MLLKYLKDRVIDLESMSSSCSSRSEEDFSKTIDFTLRKKEKISREVEQAIGYSIIKSLSIKGDQRKNMLDQYLQNLEARFDQKF